MLVWFYWLVKVSGGVSLREVSSVIACDHQEVNMLCEVSNISPRATKTSEVNNTTCVRNYSSICTAPKCFTALFVNSATTWFTYIHYLL